MPTFKNILSRESPIAVVSAAAGKMDDSAHCGTANTPTTASASTSRATYCSTGIQTLPPPNVEEFRNIHGREPTQDELVKKMGCAGMGHYGPGPRPYEVIIGKPFFIEPPSQEALISQDAAFQTSEVVHVKKSLLRTRAKATMLAKRQLNAAKAAGYDIWAEKNDDRIIHMEQYYTNIHLDDEGNATNVDIRGLSLPNICGAEISFTSLPLHPYQHDRTKTRNRKACNGRSIHSKAYTSPSGSKPCLTPRLPPEDLAVPDLLRLRPIFKIALSLPGGNPASIEDYGYLILAPKNDQKEESAKGTKTDKLQDSETTVALRDDEVTTIVVGGERFADAFIVHDATEPRPATPTGPRKRRNDDRPEIRSVQGVWKHFKTTNPNEMGNPPFSPKDGNTHQYDEVSMYLHASLQSSFERDTRSQKSTKKGSSHEGSSDSIRGGRGDDLISDDHRSRHTSRTHKSERDRSRSSVDLHGSSRYRSKGRDRGTSRNPFEEEQRHSRTAEVDQELRIPRAPASMRAADKINDMSRSERKMREIADPSAHKAQQGQNMTNAQHQAASSDMQELDVAKRNAQLKEEEAASRVGEVEDLHRLEQERTKEAEQLEMKRQLEDSEIKRARDAKNRRKLEIEEKKQAQEADRRRQQEQDRRFDREQECAANREKNKRVGRHENATLPPSVPVDKYALAREAANRRREQAAGLTVAPAGTGRRNVRERSPRHAKKEAERRVPEEKVEDNKVTKGRPERNARGELERYDPRKKFGRGR
ncbi:hypothetical protein HRS9122_09100 [Pyrenophora teres f. teres]|nr:hypothetical protein HRS9122_09100 [Pyrenophora teres f. teres]